jgi:hypothetical protein
MAGETFCGDESKKIGLIYRRTVSRRQRCSSLGDKREGGNVPAGAFARRAIFYCFPTNIAKIFHIGFAASNRSNHLSSG